MSGVRQNPAELHRLPDVVDFPQRQLPFGGLERVFNRNTLSSTTFWVRRPFQGREQPQVQRNRDFISSQRHKNRALAVDDFPSLPGVSPPNPECIEPELGEADIVDKQHSFLPLSSC